MHGAMQEVPFQSRFTEERNALLTEEKNVLTMEGIHGCQIILVYSIFGKYVHSLITPLDSSCSAIEWLLNSEKCMR